MDDEDPYQYLVVSLSCSVDANDPNKGSQPVSIAQSRSQQSTVSAPDRAASLGKEPPEKG